MELGAPFDGLGSIAALTDSTGTAVNTYKYDALGNKTTNTENVYNIWQYAGGLWSTSTGTVKFGERYYDPKIGRWTQPEPVDRLGIRFGNDYLYAGDDPVNETDPTGRCKLLWSLSCLWQRLTTPSKLERGVSKWLNDQTAEDTKTLSNTLGCIAGVAADIEMTCDFGYDYNDRYRPAPW